MTPEYSVPGLKELRRSVVPDAGVGDADFRREQRFGGVRRDE
jgi:hypothetical protein